VENANSNGQERREQLKKLGHDIKTPLGIITMGLHALEHARDEADEFEQLCKMIETDGVQPLQSMLSEILALAAMSSNDQNDTTAK
jgi:K+-sensing histidine kinase KdpD